MCQVLQQPLLWSFSAEPAQCTWKYNAVEWWKKNYFFYIDKRYGNDFYNFFYCSPEGLPPFCLSYSEPGRGGPAIANVSSIVLILNIIIPLILTSIVLNNFELLQPPATPWPSSSSWSWSLIIIIIMTISMTILIIKITWSAATLPVIIIIVIIIFHYRS